ncbi:hypothetical protein [Mycobacteroides immunogenum]|uniref:DUF3168 domain-containing protein n=1 Tax=Mycobacteroides immunogenum TaxID=83262 RepID=A0A0N1LXZ1_9MYCO|nr:hypothetical protein [Mycobacteroides immunogenum]AMT69994.1 hypothetical protein ABG82_06240 [Mycobacteroides immunogenum]ANO03054.1 hypothetical protein BAB75_06275 [Mycobacteroides immunogenum]KIU38382.1 hypothetical protein TL11_22555 [Mycobacteroides immunogenum]KPG05521.1 hypothetical protein AN909_21225 [Mycobacteroides immunogenum]KPG06392.1 hypothetical protein AN908_21605 [Mycobacteroides immunogenum]
MADALIPASATQLVIPYLTAQLAARGHTVAFSHKVPETHPARFGTVQLINSSTDHDFSDNALVEIAYFDADEARAEQVSILIKGLLQAMPASEPGVQWTEHVSGPTQQNDPDVPDIGRYLITTWVTVPCHIG